MNRLVEACPQADAGVVAQYMYRLGASYAEKGYEHLTLYLDRNPTHLTKMQTHFKALSADLPIQVEFIHFAPYSPWLNPVEYLIHWIRQRWLHHAPCSQVLEVVKERLVGALPQQVVFSFDKLVGVLIHIEQIVLTNQKSNLSP